MLVSDFTKSDNPGSTGAFRPRRSLGQNFLIGRDIAIIEARYAKDMVVLELGPGPGR